jgi:hypothetical protein
MIVLKINNTDRSSVVNTGLLKRDLINSLTDTLSFSIDVHAGQTYKPSKGDTVLMTVDGTEEFGGVIHYIKKKSVSPGRARYEVRCKDYAYDLNRELVNELYENQTVQAIISDFITTHASAFDVTNVVCTVSIKKIAFDREHVGDCIQRLADLVGYSWYVSYDKKIHFFEKNTNTAPFSIADDSGHINGTLEISDDFSQIRNRVFIKGAEVEGLSRTEEHDGDGSKKIFETRNKFAKLPTVTVNSVVQTVGVDYLDEEADFDCFWNYNEKYVRFKTAPASGTNNIDITGLPLYRLVVQVEDPVSIGANGVFEYTETNRQLKSREDAIEFAKAQLVAYKNGIVEGTFVTNTQGLRSGQIITITSTDLNVSEDFLIQSTSMTMESIEQYRWHITLATMRSVGIVQFLIDRLKSGERIIEQDEDIVIEKAIFPFERMGLSETVTINPNNTPITEDDIALQETVTSTIDAGTEFVAGPWTPSGGVKRVFLLDNSPLH